MRWWGWSVFVWLVIVCLPSARAGLKPYKFGHGSNVAAFGSEVLSAGSTLDFDDEVDPSNPFYPFFPGIDQEVSLFGHPSFSVARAHSATRQCQQRLPNRFQPCVVRFENHLPPLGRHFDRRSGTFICSVPGLYYFSFAVLSPALAFSRVSLTKNDHEVVSAYAASIGHQMASNSALILLRPGDKVCIKLFEGELYESENRLRAYTSFNGFLVQSAVNGNGLGVSTSHGAGLPPGRPFHPFGNGVNGGGVGVPAHTLEAGPRKLAAMADFNESRSSMQ